MELNCMTNIFLIAGASGVAKTSTSKRLSEKHNIIHRLGTGFIREMAKAFISKSDQPSLYRYSFDTDKQMSAYDNLYSQSLVIKPMMQLAIDRAHAEGTGLIIEGTALIPGMINISNAQTKHVLLFVENKEKHYDMINGETHEKRFVTKEQFEHVRSIQNILLKNAKENNWPIIDITKNGVDDVFSNNL